MVVFRNDCTCMQAVTSAAMPMDGTVIQGLKKNSICTPPTSVAAHRVRECAIDCFKLKRFKNGTQLHYSHLVLNLVLLLDSVL